MKTVWEMLSAWLQIAARILLVSVEQALFSSEITWPCIMSSYNIASVKLSQERKPPQLCPQRIIIYPQLRINLLVGLDLSPQIHLLTGTETAAPVALWGPVHLPWTEGTQLCPLALKEALDSLVVQLNAWNWGRFTELSVQLKPFNSWLWSWGESGVFPELPMDVSHLYEGLRKVFQTV